MSFPPEIALKIMYFLKTNKMLQRCVIQASPLTSSTEASHVLGG